MLHRLCGPPSIPLSFNLAIVLLRWITYHFSLTTEYLLSISIQQLVIIVYCVDYQGI